MLKIYRERRKFEKYYRFGHTKIIGPRLLGGRRVRPLDPLVVEDTFSHI